MLELAEALALKNKIKLDLRAPLAESKELLSLISATTTDELITRAVQKLLTVLAGGERLMLKASRRRLFVNTKYGDRLKTLRRELEMENFSLV